MRSVVCGESASSILVQTANLQMVSSTAAVQVTVNHQVVGSIPTLPAS